MSRAASVHDAPRESFAGLLDRLTQSTVAGKGRTYTDVDTDNDWEDADAVRVSISGRGTAALAEERKRTLTPVRTIGHNCSPPAEATEISYEKALRLLSQHRTAASSRRETSRQDLSQPGETSEAAFAPPKTAKPTASSGTEKRRTDASMRRDLKAAAAGAVADKQRAGTGRGSRGRRSTKHGAALPDLPGLSELPGLSNLPHAAPRAATKAKRDASRPAIASPPREATAPTTSGRRRPAKDIAAKSGSTTRRSAVVSTAQGRKSNGGDSRRHPAAQYPAAQAVKPESLEAKSDRDTAMPAALEVARRGSALEQRHAIVSIRVNDMEFDRLRLRAAESGLSVSAYMRSCVLEAEHLRAQVKQALAEMRSSIYIAPQLTSPAPQTASVSVLTRENSANSGGAWTRLLWRSATLVLGPLLAFRHRS